VPVTSAGDPRAAPPVRRAGGRLGVAVFWLPLIATAAALAARPPHTVDGPAHLLGAQVLARWHEHGIYPHFYRLSWFPTPNLAGGLLLAGLVRAVGLRAAETTMLIGCALGLPLALRYAITAVRRDRGWAGIAALPFGLNYLYFYGFYNFCLGLVLCLCCVGAVLRAAPQWRPGRTLRVGLLLLATWFTHLVAFAVAVLFLAAAVLVGPRRRSALRASLVAAAPGLGLTAAYAVHTSHGAGPQWSQPGGLLIGLLTLHTPLVTYSRAENVVAALLAAGLIVLAVRSRRTAGEHAHAERTAGWAATAAAMLYLIAPQSLGIEFGLINDRLSLFPVLFALLWLLIRPIPTRAAASAVLAGLVATAALALVRLPELRREDRRADEFLTAVRFLRPASTLVALRFAEFNPDAGRNSHWDPIRHLSNRLAAQTRSVDVGHYEAVFDYFPAQFRPDRDLRRAVDPDLTGLERVPPRINLDATLSDRGVDFVLLVAGRYARPGPAAQALATTRARLAMGWVRLGTTAPTGLVEVWARAAPRRAAAG